MNSFTPYLKEIMFSYSFILIPHWNTNKLDFNSIVALYNLHSIDN